MQIKTPTRMSALPKRTIIAMLIILLCIPAVIVVGTLVLVDRSAYMTSLLVVVLSMVPFGLVFEGRKPKARELVLIAVLVSINVAGRAAFFMLPQFKPVVALVVIVGVCLGSESGFVVGAMSAFVSNFIFGQGPWTPWQMFALGIIGFLSGVFFKNGKKMIPLCAFGAISAVVIYGGLLDISSFLMYSQAASWSALVTYLSLGFPLNVILGVATVVFLLILARPMTEKLSRIKRKYGFMETDGRL